MAASMGISDNGKMLDEGGLKGTKGIKVKDLARELGVTSRVLIDRCRAEGVAVQNSITKLDRNAEKRVRGWFRKAD
jgi:hypothetical protein